MRRGDGRRINTTLSPHIRWCQFRMILPCTCSTGAQNGRNIEDMHSHKLLHGVWCAECNSKRSRGITSMLYVYDTSSLWRCVRSMSIHHHLYLSFPPHLTSYMNKRVHTHTHTLTIEKCTTITFAFKRAAKIFQIFIARQSPHCMRHMRMHYWLLPRYARERYRHRMGRLRIGTGIWFCDHAKRKNATHIEK